MNRATITHLSWLLVTIVTFAAGSKWAASSKGGAGPGAGNAELGGRNGVGSRPAGGSTGAEGALLSAKSDRRVGEEKGGSKGPGSLEAGATNAALLDQVGIGELARRALKSSNPIERRRALDRLLEETRSSSFSSAQALLIRSSLLESGAGGKELALFDYSWGANDPTGALAYLDELPEQERDGFLSNMIPGLASAEPSAAIALFEGLEQPLQDKIRNRFYEGLIDHDIVLATDYLYDATTNAETYSWRPMDILTREIVREQGLDATLQWAANLPEGRQRGNAWSAAYAHWGASQPEVAVQEIMDMPPSADRNQAINGFISGLAGQDGEVAVLWAGEITNEGMREAAQVRAARQYFRQDPQGAADWFSNSGLPQGAWEQVTNP